MARVIIIAEGPTEEKFCKDIMFPYFYNKGLYDIRVSILPSKITAPSKRIEKYFPSYGKTSDGIIVAEAIGIEKILSKCILFNQWIKRIEEELRKN